MQIAIPNKKNMKLLSKLQRLKNRPVSQNGSNNCAFQAQKIEDCDSGTASDEENPEIQLHTLQEAMQKCGFSPVQVPVPYPNPHPGAIGQHPPAYQVSANTPRTMTTLKFSLASYYNAPAQDHRGPTLGARPMVSGNTVRRSLDSSTVSSDQESDLDRCSLDFEPDSSLDFENHGSEDETDRDSGLHSFTSYTDNNNYIMTSYNTASNVIKPSAGVTNVLSTTTEGGPRWKPFTREVTAGNEENAAGASDEEVSELLSSLHAPTTPTGEHQQPLQEQQPPQQVQESQPLRRRHSSSTVLRPRAQSDVTTAATTSAILRRKRHASDGSRDTTVIYRPCLDFEKMQVRTQYEKNVLRKPVPHGVNKVRIVKIKGPGGATKPVMSLNDPANYSFRPIGSCSPIAPVEEPSLRF